MGVHHPHMKQDSFISWHGNSVMDEGHVQYTSQYQDILAEQSMAASMWYLHCCENITDRLLSVCKCTVLYNLLFHTCFSWLVPQHIML